MSIAFSGDYLGIAGAFDAGDGTGLSLTVSIGETDFEFKKVEVQSESDNLQDPNSVVYVSIEAHPYEMIE
jgi:hypothetical protein